MPKKDSVKPSTQHTAFKKVARELGCDQSEAAFDKALKMAGKAKPGKKADA